MKVLVTGSRGQVGRYLEQQLAAKPWISLILDRYELDITNSEKVNSVVTDFKPDVIINAAAFTAVDKAESNRELAFDVNERGPKNLAQSAQKIGAAIIHISTDYVFDGSANRPYMEEDPVAPKGVYGASKLAGERAVMDNCARCIVLRTAWVFGEYGRNFVKNMIKLGTKREELTVVNDQYGGPTFAGDIAEAVLIIVSRIGMGKELSWGKYHYSGMPHVSWYEFAMSVFNAAVDQGLLMKAPRLAPISSADYTTEAKRPNNSKLDCGKIGKEFGIEPSEWQLALNNIQNYK
ncbi:MAG: dTDP-4-dehydrorhamnose reductase [Motiliproteus sp.]|nr:dTDP-4-dehydrorhamnose reductase [Motiliproteus sp.]MCW9052531.1 dTDP-4-dehydrorhamnose reductase [Motiliproteus sp.]